MGKHLLWLTTDRGELLALLDNWISIEYVRTFNGVGNFEIWLDGLPGGAVFNNTKSRASLSSSRSEASNLNGELLRPDRMLQIWRRPGGNERIYAKAPGRYGKRLETVGFLRSWDIRAAESLKIQTALRGPDINNLFERRIIAYDTGSAQAEKSQEADDMLKAMVRENLGSTAGTNRDLSSLGFSITSNLGLAPVITKGFAWRPLLDAMLEVADASRQEGTPLYFGIIPTSPTTFRFITGINHLGQDRTAGSGNPLVFGLKWGNMSNAVLNTSHLDEKSFIYALGTGRFDNRTVTEVFDQSRLDASVWNRIEGTADAKENNDGDAVGKAKLAEYRPGLHFSADIHDTPDLPYGGPGGWDLGDRVTVSYKGLQFDCTIESVHVSANRNGTETIRARVEYNA